MTILTIGVDPGEHGAIACVNENRELQFVWNLPMTNHWGHKVLDAVQLNYRLSNQISVKQNDCRVVFERVTSFAQNGRTMGARSAFSFGANSLGMIPVFELLGFRIMPPITPVQWKQSLNLIGKDKQASIDLATKLMGVHFANDNEAEAALIAYACVGASVGKRSKRTKK